MTQTSTTPAAAARNTFLADQVTVTPGSSLKNSYVLDFTDDNPSRVATVVTTALGAEQMLTALAGALGYRLVAEDTAQALGAMVRGTIADADARDALVQPSLTALNAHRDAMRDMRDALRRADVIAG